MLNDITLGQFFPGNSILHRLDPRIKLILTLIWIVTLFLAKSLLPFVLLALFTVLMVGLSRISLRLILKGLKPLYFVLLFTMVLNIFWSRSEGEPLLQWRFITVYADGIWRACYMALRVVLLVIGTSLLISYTTSPIMLTDALEDLLSPLKKCRVPVHEFAMMMTIALRFIPTLIEETDKIMNAQKARGADFSSGGLLRRAKALIPILIPLFVSSFKRAEDLAQAMECRCYRGGEGRTRMMKFTCTFSDFAVLFVFLLLPIAILLLHHYLPLGFSL